jgi:hypothetical protein
VESNKYQITSNKEKSRIYVILRNAVTKNPGEEFDKYRFPGKGHGSFPFDKLRVRMTIL